MLFSFSLRKMSEGMFVINVCRNNVNYMCFYKPVSKTVWSPSCAGCVQLSDMLCILHP